MMPSCQCFARRVKRRQMPLRIELRGRSGVTSADLEEAMKEPKDTSKPDPIERDPLPQERPSEQQKEDTRRKP
jgi:hypothetical protein